MHYSAISLQASTKPGSYELRTICFSNSSIVSEDGGQGSLEDVYDVMLYDPQDTKGDLQGAHSSYSR